MKNLFYLLIAGLMLACGSGSPNKTYENTITGHLLKGGDTKENLNFKVLELSEVGKVTVSDSIAYLTDEFRKDKQLIINRVELARKTTEELKSKARNQQDQARYSTDIATYDTRIDSLKNLMPDNLNGYDSRNADDVLAIIVRCKYSLVPPGSTVVEETFDFYLSPDGTKYYGKQKVG